MSGFAVVLAKECRDNIRDRRTIISSFSLAIFGPLLFVGLIALVLNTTIGESREGFSLTVTGAANAPGLVAYLGTQNLQLTETDLEDPKQAVTDGTHPLVLVIDDDYPERFASGQMASVALVYDSSGTGKARRNLSIARQIIAGYGQQIGMSLDISVVACLQIFAVSIPLMVFGAALLTVAASFAKSYKEAQTYLTMVILLPTLPLVVTQLMNVEPSDALMLVPSLSQASLIADIIKGEALSVARIGLSVLGTGATAALLCALAVHLYRRERILV